MRIGVAKPQDEATRTTEGNSLEVTNRGAAAQRFRSSLPLTGCRPTVSLGFSRNRNRAAVTCNGSLGSAYAYSKRPLGSGIGRSSSLAVSIHS